MSQNQLFHDDNATYFNFAKLEALAQDVVDQSSLITRCQAGDRDAVVALKLGFWPFTSAFEKAIDKRLRALPRKPLYAKFGHKPTREHLTARVPEALEKLAQSEMQGAFPQEEELRHMQRDEWKHSAHWAKDAENLGISREQLEQAIILPSVQTLIDVASSEDIVVCFAAAYSATEFIAEALGAKLAECQPAKQLFQRKRWIWMEVHTEPHDEGPSHEEIVMDFARAYDDSGSPARIEMLVASGIYAFGVAARDVEAYYGRPSLVAAE